MEYTINLKVSDSELYYTLIDSAIGEVNVATGKTITYKDLEGGYKYKRKMDYAGKSVEVTTHIRQPIEKRRIQINVDRIDDHYEMIYDIKYIDKNLTELTFTQTDKYKIKNFIQKMIFNSSMKKKFKKIEKIIIQKRKEK